MRKILTLLENHRITKFQKRGWSIDVATYEPVVHLSLKTSFHVLRLEDLAQYDSKWIINMINKSKYTLKEALLIKNRCFEVGYDSAKCWIAKETNNLNSVILYHGASEEGAKAIAQTGFDSRYCGKVFGQTFGRGVYFTDDPMYADQYVSPNRNQ